MLRSDGFKNTSAQGSAYFFAMTSYAGINSYCTHQFRGFAFWWEIKAQKPILLLMLS